MNKKQFQIFLKGEDQSENVESYRRIGGVYEVIFYNGKSFRYNASNVRVIESVLIQEKAKNCFEYLKSIAALKGDIAPKNEKETSFK